MCGLKRTNIRGIRVCIFKQTKKKHTTFLECVCVLHNVMVGRYSNRRDGTARIIEQTPRYELISHSCAYLPLLFVDKNSDLIQPWAKRHRTAYKIRLITVDPQSQTIWVCIWNVNCARCATVPINLNTEHLLNTTWYDKLGAWHGKQRWCITQFFISGILLLRLSKRKWSRLGEREQ